jgi:RNA polymerase sigma factor (sigma-70 family)
MPSASLVRQLGALFDAGSLAGLSDRQLIERFDRGRDDAAEAAFAAIVARHGPMVLGVCRQLLGDHHLAEDAFQAVFLVLAQKAHCLRDPDRLGPWLHGVALRTARKARARRARHRRHEQGDLMDITTSTDAASRPLVEPTAPPADRALLDRDQAAALHVAIDRLPDAFRSPVVLCYFEGLTLDEAARRLRCPAGTLRSRLARAREKLRRSLTRRGVAFSTAALAAALEVRPASASVPPALCDMTARAALRFAARQAAASTAAVLAREVLRGMVIHKLKAAAVALVLLATLAAGAGYGALNAFARPGEGEPNAQKARTEPRPPDRPSDRRSPDRNAARTGPPPTDPSRPAPGRMFVVGRVLAPDGKPVPDAKVMVLMQRKVADQPLLLNEFGAMTADDGRCDGSGHFRIELPRSSTARHDGVVLTAMAPGYAIGWTDFDPDADSPAVEVTLRAEQVIRGRLLDVHGQPARGVKVRVSSISSLVREESPSGVSPPDASDYPRQDWPAWPTSATSDDDGRFALRGLGRGLQLSIRPDDPRFDRSNIIIRTDGGPRPSRGRVPAIQVDPGPDPKPITIALQPGRTIVGRVTYADTGEPVPHALIGITGYRHRADAEGRFRIGIEAAYPSGSVMSVVARSPDGAPYLMALKRPVWPKAAVEQSVDVALRRGVVIRGKVTEEKSGRPIAGAVVLFAPYKNAPGETWYLSFPVATDQDGAYRVAAPRGPGYLVVQGPSDDYVLREFGAAGVQTSARPGRRRFYAHAYRALDLEPDGPDREVDLALRPGAAVHGRILGPDGQPIRDALIFSRTILRSMPNGGWKFWMVFGSVAHTQVRDGQFVLHGLDPDAEVPAYVLDPERKLGATVRLSGRSAANGPVAVRLEPCGTARCRFVGPDGRPLGRYDAGFLTTMVITPGPSSQGNPAKDGPLLADEAPLSRLGRRAVENPFVSDAQGRLTLPALIPGATYRIADPTSITAGGEPAIRKEFTVKPGEALDLGEILIEKPPR